MEKYNFVKLGYATDEGIDFETWIDEENKLMLYKDFSVGWRLEPNTNESRYLNKFYSKFTEGIYCKKREDCLYLLENFEKIKKEYLEILESGMFFEFFPDLSGDWGRDYSKFSEFCKNREEIYDNYNKVQEAPPPLGVGVVKHLNMLNWKRNDRLQLNK